MDDDVLDYFAGCALTGLIIGNDGWGSEKELALRSYEIAELMMQVREMIKRGDYE